MGRGIDQEHQLEDTTCDQVRGSLSDKSNSSILDHDYDQGISVWGISPGRDFEHTVKLGLYGNRGLNDKPANTTESNFKPEPAYKGLAKEVFGQSSFELVRNHNQVLDVNEADVMQKHGISKDDPVVLINFDSHSDMYLYPMEKDGKESIANWVNTTLARNPNITDFYWVLPNEFKNNPELHQHFFMDPDKSMALDDQTRSNLGVVEPNLKVFFNNSTGKMHLYKLPKGANKDDFRQVNIHKVALDDLPNMKGKNVILSTDLDGFANKGHDTEKKAKVPFQAEQGFENYLKQLKEKGVRPFLHTVSVSPEYLQDEHLNSALDFASLTGEVSRYGMDMNITNERNLIAPDRVEKPGEIPQLPSGLTIERDQNKDFQLLYHMFTNDRKTRRPDGAINLTGIDKGDGTKFNDELEAGLNRTMQLYGLNRGDAKKLLKRWDAKDGKKDGYLQFQSIEELLVNKCHKNES